MSCRNLLVAGSLVLILLAFTRCVSRDYESLPAFSEGHQVMMVVEIAAGTSIKIEYNRKQRAFIPDSVEGVVRSIDFLPYLVNCGFIPSTIQDASMGGDGDPLDVMLIGQALPAGTIIKVLPIAILRLKDGGVADDKILAIPADPAQRIIQADDFASLSVGYPSILSMINDWFVAYKGAGVIESAGWGDETEAWQKIMLCCKTTPTKK